jgi:type III secretion protein J
LVLTGCAVELEHDLDEREANHVLAVLDEAGVAADKRSEDSARYLVSVGRNDVARAVRLLEAQGLPRRGPRSLSDALAGSLLPSPAESHARVQAAIAAELERTLETMPQVALARVHVALPEEEPLLPSEAAARPTASVLLKLRPAANVDEAAVRHLVAGAVHTLAQADVTVVTARAGEAPPTPLVRAAAPPVALASALVAILLLGLGLLTAALRLSSLRRRLAAMDR